MKLFYKLLFLSFAAIILNAQTTMCYKENHTKISTIETVKLNGGLCQGSKTVKDMLKEGWLTEDIKINNNNYIYIFKKVTTVSDVNMEELENRVLQRLKNEKIEKNKLDREKSKKFKINKGKSFYANKCSACHGINGESTKYGTRALNSLSLKDFKQVIREYNIGEKTDRGNDKTKRISPYATMMVPYAEMLTENKIHNVYVYLKSLNETRKRSNNKEEKK